MIDTVHRAGYPEMGHLLQGLAVCSCAVNLLDALEDTPAALYQVIAALDVFIYAGDLTAAIPNALRILVPGGH